MGGVDCHASTSALARNDKSQVFKQSRRILGLVQILKQKLGGRILELESGLYKARAEISLGCLSHKRGAGIADSSPKANAKARAILLLVLLALVVVVGGCTTTTREAVYIPTKCKTKPIPKPTPSKDSSISQDVAEILQYTELLERDLEFCRGE